MVAFDDILQCFCFFEVWGLVKIIGTSNSWGIEEPYLWYLNLWSYLIIWTSSRHLFHPSPPETNERLYLNTQVDNESNTEPLVRFVPLRMFSRQVHFLLNENGGRLSLANLETCYLERFGIPIKPSSYGHSSVISLLQAIFFLVVIRGKGPKRFLTLHKEMAGTTIDPSS